MSDAAEALVEVLGTELPPQIANLDDDSLRWLRSVIEDQTQVQVDALDQSCQDVVAQLPTILRGPARAIIGG